MKKLAVFLTLLGLFASFFAGTVTAKNHDEIPEVDGVYDDPGHPGVKVRVFVYKQKPGPTPGSKITCNLPDPDSTATVSSIGWKLPSSWTYNLNPASAPSSVGSVKFATLAEKSFATWSGASGKVSFIWGNNTRVNTQSDDGLNIVAWGKLNASAIGITYIRYDSASGAMIDIDTILNQRFPWSWTDQSVNLQCAGTGSFDAQNILTHELGHWMGLSDQYQDSYSESTMYGYGTTTEVKKDTLTTGDISGLSLIYTP